MAATESRIPIRLAARADAAPDEWVIESVPSEQKPLHAAGCSCCGGRGGLAKALGALFIARARGDVPPFRGVVLTDLALAPALAAALREDRLVAARFVAAP